MSYTSADTRALVEGGILSGMAVIMTLLAIYMPLLGIIAQLILAFPIMILVVRHGIKPGLIASMVTAVLIFSLGGLFGALYFFSLVPAALVIGWAIREGKGIVWSMTLGTFSGFLAKLAFLGISMWFLKLNYLAAFEESLRSGAKTALAFYQTAGIDPAALQELTRNMEQMVPLLIVLVPAFFVILAAMEVFINLWLAEKLLRKFGQTSCGLPPLRHWDMPKTFLYGWVLSFAAGTAGAYYFGEQALTYKFGINCFMLFSCLLFLQGLAVLSFFLAKYNVSKVLRVILGIMVIFIPLLSLIVFYVGGFDLYANFRKLQR